jgi:hypothetical protein
MKLQIMIHEYFEIFEQSALWAGIIASSQAASLSS